MFLSGILRIDRSLFVQIYREHREYLGGGVLDKYQFKAARNAKPTSMKIFLVEEVFQNVREGGGIKTCRTYHALSCMDLQLRR